MLHKRKHLCVRLTISKWHVRFVSDLDNFATASENTRLAIEDKFNRRLRSDWYLDRLIEFSTTTKAGGWTRVNQSRQARSCASSRHPASSKWPFLQCNLQSTCKHIKSKQWRNFNKDRSYADSNVCFIVLLTETLLGNSSSYAGCGLTMIYGLNLAVLLTVRPNQKSDDSHTNDWCFHVPLSTKRKFSTWWHLCYKEANLAAHIPQDGNEYCECNIHTHIYIHTYQQS